MSATKPLRIIPGMAITVLTVLSIFSSYDQVDRIMNTRTITPTFVPDEATTTTTTSKDDKTDDKGTTTLSFPLLTKGGSAMSTAETNSPPKPALVAPWTRVITKDNGKTKLPRAFIFTEVVNLEDYAIKIKKYDEDEYSQLKSLLMNQICEKAKATTLPQKLSSADQGKCKADLQVWKCSTCTGKDGAWYVGSSLTGSVFGQTDQGNPPIHFPSSPAGYSENKDSGPPFYKQLEIIVPIAHEDDKLKVFVQRLAGTVRKFRENHQGKQVALRLLITRFKDESFPSEKDQADVEKTLESKAGFNPAKGDSIKFIPVNEIKFSRAKAINALHKAACHEKHCVLACTDVDMSIGVQFLRNALMYPFPGATAYFPIMWSEYNPETRELADKFYPNIKQYYFNEHHGYWRKWSFGMYAIAGSDANYLKMNEGFEGWGGEDGDFYRRVSESLNTVRMFERGLVHVFHSKDCSVGSFVGPKYFKACIGAKVGVEGSALGMYLRSMKIEEPKTFDFIMTGKAPATKVPPKKSPPSTTTAPVVVVVAAAAETAPPKAPEEPSKEVTSTTAAPEVEKDTTPATMDEPTKPAAEEDSETTTTTTATTPPKEEGETPTTEETTEANPVEEEATPNTETTEVKAVEEEKPETESTEAELVAEETPQTEGTEANMDGGSEQWPNGLV